MRMNNEHHSAPTSTHAVVELGLIPRERVDFQQVAADRLREELPPVDPEVLESRRRTLVEHGVSLDPAVLPPRLDLGDFTEEDWAAIRDSPLPLVEFWSTARDLRLHGSAYAIERDFVREQIGRDGFTTEALLRALPVVIGTTAQGFRDVMESGGFLSYRTRFEQDDSDPGSGPREVNGRPSAATTLTGDMWDGTDAFVFGDFGRPDRRRAGSYQPEVIVAVDPEAMLVPGAFMTDLDYADAPAAGIMSGRGQPMTRYLEGAATPRTFYAQALDKLIRGEVSSHWVGPRLVVRRQGVDGFIAGQDQGLYETHNYHDGESKGGRHDPSRLSNVFSTWEVKLPDGAATPDRFVRVIVRDLDTYEALRSQYPDVPFVHIDQLHPMDPNNPRAPGNYTSAFVVPEIVEREWQKLRIADYNQRVAALTALPEDQQEEVVVALGSSIPGETDLRQRVDIYTSLARHNSKGKRAEYTSIDELLEDVRAPLKSFNGYDQGVTSQGMPLWFGDFRQAYGFKDDGGGSHNRCVIVTVRRSRSNPEISVITGVGEFELPAELYNQGLRLPTPQEELGPIGSAFQSSSTPKKPSGGSGGRTPKERQMRRT